MHHSAPPPSHLWHVPTPLYLNFEWKRVWSLCPHRSLRCSFQAWRCFYIEFASAMEHSSRSSRNQGKFYNLPTWIFEGSKPPAQGKWLKLVRPRRHLEWSVSGPTQAAPGSQLLQRKRKINGHFEDQNSFWSKSNANLSTMDKIAAPIKLVKSRCFPPVFFFPT